MYLIERSIPSHTVRHDDRSGEVIRWVVASIVISLVMFSCRIAARSIKKHNLTISDLILFFGMLCCWGFCGMNIWTASRVLGIHIEYALELDPKLVSIKLGLKSLIINECLYAVSLVAIKISILLLYLSVLPVRTVIIGSHILSALTLVWGLAVCLASIFACSPINGSWEPHMQPEPKCINKAEFYVGVALPNTLLDIAILVLPIREVWKLRLDKKEKIGLTITFLLGGCVCIASIVRFTMLFQINDDDLTWTFVNITNWSALEMALAVASACLPTMRPLLPCLIPDLIRRRVSSSASKPKDIPAPILLTRFTLTNQSAQSHQLISPTHHFTENGPRVRASPV